MNKRPRSRRERNLSILRLSKDGKIPVDIAAQFNISVGRVRQIILTTVTLEERRAELKKLYGARPNIDKLSDDTPIDVLILCDANISGWNARVLHLQCGSVPIRTLGDLRSISSPKLLREPHIGAKMLAQLRAFCPFRRAGKKAP
jgi:hypothetical protein